MLDACYRSFLQEEEPGFPRYSRLMELACPGGEVILLDSLTKFFCCPGVRLGFAVTGKELAAGIESCRPSWSVGMAAEDAGLTLLEKESAYRSFCPLLQKMWKIWPAIWKRAACSAACCGEPRLSRPP